MAKKTPKTKVLSVRLPLDESELVEKAAVEAGTTVSAYVAQLLKSPGKSKVPAPEVARPAPVIVMPVLADDAVMGEVRRIGININQIARATNAGLPSDLARFARSMGLLLDALSDPTEFKRRLGMVKARFPTPPQVASPPVQTATPKLEPPKSTPPSRPPVPPHLVEEIQKALATPSPAPKPQRAPEPRYEPQNPAPPSREPAPYAPYQGQATAPRDAPPVKAKLGKPPARRPRPAPLPTPPASPVLPTPKRTPTGLSHDHTHPQARHQLQDRHRVHPSRHEQGDEGPGRLGILGKLWKW